MSKYSKAIDALVDGYSAHELAAMIVCANAKAGCEPEWHSETIECVLWQIDAKRIGLPTLNDTDYWTKVARRAGIL